MKCVMIIAGPKDKATEFVVEPWGMPFVVGLGKRWRCTLVPADPSSDEIYWEIEPEGGDALRVFANGTSQVIVEEEGDASGVWLERWRSWS